MPGNERKCPYCAETIGADAIKCEHCGSLLKGSSPKPGASDLFNADSPTAGDHVLSGRYRIINNIGRGGMGVVYLAHDEELDMDVAVKLLPFELASDKRSLDLLRSEAKVSMSLSHPNIVRLHTLDTSGHFKFLVMEYVDGPSLHYVLRKKGKLRIEKALPIIRSICDGVAYAHSKRILHRDIKPANIMMTAKGEIKIADFGIARQMHESMSMLSQKIVAGTPSYMAPEHIMGEHMTVRSEVYSVAAVTYEILAGHPPFYTGDIPTQVRFKDPPAITGVSKPVNDVIHKALAKDADERQESVLAFYDMLKDAVLRMGPETEPIFQSSMPTEVVPDVPRTRPKKPQKPEEASTGALRDVGFKKDLRAPGEIKPPPRPAPVPQKKPQSERRIPPAAKSPPSFSPPRQSVPAWSDSTPYARPKRAFNAGQANSTERPPWSVPLKVAAVIFVYFWVSVLCTNPAYDLCPHIVKLVRGAGAPETPIWLKSLAGMILGFGFAGIASAVVVARLTKLFKFHWNLLAPIILGLAVLFGGAIAVVAAVAF